MKKIFTRTTTEKKFEDLHPKFLRYFYNAIDSFKLDVSDKQILRCFETQNEKKGFLGKKITNKTVICASDKYLFWAIIKEKKETGIAAALFNEIQEITDYETSEAAKIFEDHGINCFGFIYKFSRRSSWFIGLGNDTPGEQCRSFIRDLHAKSLNK